MNRNDQEYLVQKIRTQYTEKEHTQLDALKALDAKVKKPANIFAYVFGGISAIIMGSGMSLIMTDIGSTLGMTDTMIPGIIIGVIGMLIGVPVFALLYYAVKSLVNERLESKNLTTVTDFYDDNILDKFGDDNSPEEIEDK